MSTREALSLEHKPLIEPLLQGLDLELSEYSFANLYLFRKVHHYELIFSEDLYIQGRSYDNKRFLMPCGLQAAKNITCQKQLAQELGRELGREVDFIFPIPEAWLPFYEGVPHNAAYKEEDSDYLFSIEALATYKGRRLSKKRNLLKQFLEQYSATSVSVSIDRMPKSDFDDLLARWKSDDDADLEEIQEAFGHIADLGLEGVAYYCEGKAIGVLIGERLSARLFVLHFAKGDNSYKGVYAYMYHDYAASLLRRDMQLLNLEQDLGNPNLHQAKHAYMPLRMAHKWRVTLL